MPRNRDSWSTQHSVVTENSDRLDMKFPFDGEIINSRAYQTAIRSSIRQALSRKGDKTAQRQIPRSADVIDVEHSSEIEIDSHKMTSDYVALRHTTEEITNGLSGESGQAYLGAGDNMKNTVMTSSNTPDSKFNRKEAHSEDGLPGPKSSSAEKSTKT